MLYSICSGNICYLSHELLPYRGEKVCESPRPIELYWLEIYSLVGLPLPEWSKGRGQTKCSSGQAVFVSSVKQIA